MEEHFNVCYGVPSHNTVLLWFKKIGYYKLTQAKEIAKDWILIIDESIQFGNEKLLVIYGIMESNLPVDRAIRFTDLVPLLIKVSTNWNGETIKEEILALKNKIGEVIYAVCDHGSDIKKALRLANIKHIHDITHHAALILKKIYLNNEEFLELTKTMAEMRGKKIQTSLAHICPPNQRAKSRFQNIHVISKWGMNCFKILKGKKSKEKDELMWIKKYKNIIIEMDSITKLLGKIFHVVKNKGLNESTIKECKVILKKSKGKNGKIFRAQMIEYFKTYAATVKVKENLLCSSDIIESSFGKMKNIVSQNKMAGITDLSLCMSSFTCNLSNQFIKEALENTTVENVNQWAADNIGLTLFKKRNLAFSSG